MTVDPDGEVVHVAGEGVGRAPPGVSPLIAMQHAMAGAADERQWAPRDSAVR